MKKRREKTPAVGYLRTSSAANVGADKDSDKRQRASIQRFAKSAGYAIDDADWFYDESVSGADPLMDRPGFRRLLQRIEGNGVRVMIVEDASRFARELLIQETGVADLRRLGVTVLTAAGDDLTNTMDPGRTMMRQVAGAFSEYEKARLVAKLKSARDRMIAETGRCGGRQPLKATHPDVVALAKRLRRASPKTGERISFRRIAKRLADAGHLNSKGLAYSAKVIKSMVES